jgi:hypothetical protein
MSTTHLFERAGLGLAPFRFVRRYSASYQACPGAHVQPGAACDYCGTGIYNVFVVQSSDGREFKVGSDCVLKTGDYGLVQVVRNARRVQARERRVARAQQARAERAQRAVADAQKFLAAHEGLADALAIDHHITRDLAAKLQQWGSLSERQVALAFRLVEQATQRAAEAAQLVEAPQGRHAVQGRVATVKEHESQFGRVLKMLVVITTPDGTWKAWGTVPSEVEREAATQYRARSEAQFGRGVPLLGRIVSFTASFERGRDRGFAFFKRPTKASLVQS